MSDIYSEVYRHSIEDPEGFWGKIAESLYWYRKWDRVLDDSTPPFYRWFVGGKTNLCYNAVDRHALGDAKNKAAIIWEGAAQKKSRIITYDELYREVNRFAIVLKNLGVQKGDRVVIYLPMVPEALIAMLACLRIGAIHVVVFTGFGVDALADRIIDAKPKVVITADGNLRRGKAIHIKEIVDKALEKAPVETVIVLDRGVVAINVKKGRDYCWTDLIRETTERYIEPVQLESTDPSYILYTSGATGKPYGVVRDTGGYMVALYNSMKQLYDAREGDVFWATSDVGWVVGHSYVVYAPLLCGITTVMFEGTPDYPDHGVWWRLVEKYGVSIMYSSPTAMKMLKRFGVEHARKCDISTLRCLFLAGEILDEDTWQWATDALDNKPVIDHYWSTESGWPIIANTPGIELLPIKPGSPAKPVVGYDLTIVDRNGKPVPANTKGYLLAKPPLPPGTIATLWEDDERYKKEYWQQFPEEALFSTGDYAVADDDGYLTLLGRVDEVLNVAAHRIGAIAAPRDIRFVHMLPKTRSGEYMRRVLKAVYEGRNLEDLSTVEDGASVGEVKEAIAEMKKMLG